MRSLKSFTIASILSLSLTACGGGGSSNDDDDNDDLGTDKITLAMSADDHIIHTAFFGYLWHLPCSAGHINIKINIRIVTR